MAGIIRLAEKVNVSVLVDHEEHILMLNHIAMEIEAVQKRRWSIFMRVDRGTRAPVRLKQLLDFLPENGEVALRGFYCDASEVCGRLQPSDTSESLIEQQLSALIMAAELVGKDTPLILSLEATSSKDLAYHPHDPLPDCWKLEYRCGDFAVNDLQRVSRSLATTDDIAVCVLAEACSIYEERLEVLVNAGAAALSRESSDNFPGYGTVAGRTDWYVGRLSQEQGVLVMNDEDRVPRFPFSTSSSVLLWVQNLGVTASAYDCYFVVGGRRNVVLEVWHRWSEW